MHVLYEILAERNEEQDAEHTTEQRAEEHLEEADCDVGIAGLQDIKRRQCEYGTGHNYTRACADALYYHILPECVFLSEGSAQSDRYDGYGDSGLEHLSHLKAKIGGCGTEHDRQQQAHAHGIGRDFGVLARGMHERTVVLVGSKFAERVVGQLDRVHLGWRGIVFIHEC